MRVNDGFDLAPSRQPAPMKKYRTADHQRCLSPARQALRSCPFTRGWAIISITQALAYELAKHNIKVNCLCPGIVEARGVGRVSKGYVENPACPRPRDQAVHRESASQEAGGLKTLAFTRFLTVDRDYCAGGSRNRRQGNTLSLKKWKAGDVIAETMLCSRDDRDAKRINWKPRRDGEGGQGGPDRL
jgi:hypothetical protein